MPTVDRLREDINRGRTGDKVPFHDPAAAPLGTDDEAAGTPPSPEDIATARAAEIGGDARRGPAVTDERSRSYDGQAPDTLPGKAPTPWPGGRRRNRRAAFLLLGAVLAMSALLSVWAALMS